MYQLEMNSLAVVDSMKLHGSHPVKPKILELFSPVRKLIRTNNFYQLGDSYQNLSHYKFNEEEVDFLCECYHSGINSVIGTTSFYGKPRLTITGVQERYQISADTMKQWLLDYRKKIESIERERANIEGIINYNYPEHIYMLTHHIIM